MSEPTIPESTIIDADATEAAPSRPGTDTAQTYEALLEVVRRGLTGDADDAVRASACDAWHTLGSALGSVPGAAAAAPASPAPVPTLATTIAAMFESLRKLPPDQLLDLAINRLRAALPAQAPVMPSPPVRFQLIPLPPVSGQR